MGIVFAIVVMILNTIFCEFKGVSEGVWQIVRAINFAYLTIIVATRHGVNGVSDRMWRIVRVISFVCMVIIVAMRFVV